MRRNLNAYHSMLYPIMAGGLLLTAVTGNAASIKTIYDFDGSDGFQPGGAPIVDADGNLYGVTAFGGVADYGTVYELSPPAAGRTVWTRKTLFEFKNSHYASPYDSLLMDSFGDLYGLGWGGQGNGVMNSVGFAFELSPPASGHTVWSEKPLHSFINERHGYGFQGPLIADVNGNLYGVATSGGKANDGVVFKLTPPAAGDTVWGETVLFEFSGADGRLPNPGLIKDASGALYGTTNAGGANNKGAVFQLKPPANGHTVWTERVLYSFKGGTGGDGPNCSLVADTEGALYGSLSGIGEEPGQIFKLTPPAAGHTVWHESVVYRFSDSNMSAGIFPSGTMVFDSLGALYGTADNGTAYGRVVFKLTPPSSGIGRWTETVLSSSSNKSATVGFTSLMSDGNGHIYGTATLGGAYGKGSIYEITP